MMNDNVYLLNYVVDQKSTVSMHRENAEEGNLAKKHEKKNTEMTRTQHG